MRASQLFAVGFASIALAGCASSGASSGTSAGSTSVPGRTLVTNLTPQNFGGAQISGKARLTPTGRAGEMRAEIEIRGSGFQTQMPWAVRTGRCGEAGQEVGNPISYRQLTTAADGTAKLSTNVQVSIPDGETHSVVIYRNQQERQIVACGVLSIEP